MGSVEAVSPLDTADIARGRVEAAKSQANQQAETVLSRTTLPPIGSRVEVDHGDGTVEIGIIKDVFEDDTGSGVVIDREGKSPIRDYFDTIQDAGVIIRAAPSGPLAEADALDADMARRASSAREDIGKPSEQVSPGFPSSSTVQAPVVTAPPKVSTPQAATPATAGGAVSEFMARTRQAESSGDDTAKNRRSSATGRYQFTDATWQAYYAKIFGNTGESPTAILAKRKDGALQDRLMQALTTDNANGLRGAGIDANVGNLYLAHFAGIAGAKALHRNPGASVETVLGQKTVNANPFLRGMSAADVINWAARKMGGKAPAFAGNSGGTSGATGTPAAQPSSPDISIPRLGSEADQLASISGQQGSPETLASKPSTISEMPAAAEPPAIASLSNEMEEDLRSPLPQGTANNTQTDSVGNVSPISLEQSPVQPPRLSDHAGRGIHCAWRNQPCCPALCRSRRSEP